MRTLNPRVSARLANALKMAKRREQERQIQQSKGGGMRVEGVASYLPLPPHPTSIHADHP